MKRMVLVSIMVVLIGVSAYLVVSRFRSRQVAPAPAVATGPTLPTLPNGRYAPGIRMAVRTLATFPSYAGPSIVSPDGTRVVGTGLFSPDSKHLAVTSSFQNTVQVNLDNGPSAGHYLTVNGLTFSPDSRHFVYGAKRLDKTAALVTDGVEKPCDPVDYVPVEIRFTPDGRHLAYVGSANIDAHDSVDVCVDGKAWPEHYSWGNSLRISPDGKRVALVADWHVLENGVIQEPRPKVSGNIIVFSPDSTQMIYVGQKGEEQTLVVNGQETKTYNRVQSDSITFSPDGKHLAYSAYTGNETTNAIDFDPRTGSGSGKPLKGHCVVNIDGKESRGQGTDFVFSSDSKHLAYVEAEMGIIRGEAPESPQFIGSGVTLDGVHLGRSINAVQFLQFSPDNRHVAYLTCGSASENPTIVVDGIELPFPEEGFVTHLWFTASDTLIAIVQYAEMGKEIRRVELKLKAP